MLLISGKKLKVNGMKWVIFSLVLLIVGCSPSKRIKWHVNRLEKLERSNPELFSKTSIDSVINARALALATKMFLSLDSNRLKALYKQSDTSRSKTDSAIKETQDKGVKDCDTIIKYIQLERKPQTQIKEVHKQSKCIVNATYLDTLGVHVKIFDKNGSVGVSVQVDSIHIKKDCPPCFTPKQPEYWEFWQFWFWVISAPLICCLLLTFVIKLILRRNWK